MSFALISIHVVLGEIDPLCPSDTALGCSQVAGCLIPADFPQLCLHCKASESVPSLVIDSSLFTLEMLRVKVRLVELETPWVLHTRAKIFICIEMCTVTDETEVAECYIYLLSFYRLLQGSHSIDEALKTCVYLFLARRSAALNNFLGSQHHC